MKIKILKEIGDYIKYNEDKIIKEITTLCPGVIK